MKWIIPYIYLTTAENHEVFIISPWIDPNVLLDFTWINENYEITLLDLALEYESKHNVKSHFIFSDIDTDNKINQRSSSLLKNKGLEYSFLSKLHMKAVVGERLLYHGSANITYSGINLNSEFVTLERILNQTFILRNILGDVLLGRAKN